MMKKLLFLLLISLGVKAQTITTNFQNTSICFGGPVSVPFTATGFPNGTEYKVQLLDKDGGTVLYDNEATGTASPINFDATNIRIGAFAVKVMAINQLTVNSVASSGLLFVGPYAKMSNANGNHDDVSVALGDSATLKINLYGAAPWVFTYSDGTFQHSIKTSSNPYFLKVAPKQNTRYNITKVSNSCGTNSSLDDRVTVLINTPTSLALPNPTSLNICGGGSVKIPLNYTGNWSNDVAIRVFLTDTSGLYIPNSEQIINYKADTINFLLPNDLVVNKEYKIRVVVTKPYLLINYLNSTYKLTVTGNNCTPEATILASEPSCGGTILQAYPRDAANSYHYQWFKNNVVISDESRNYLFAADSAQYHVRVYQTGYNSFSDSVLVWQKAMEVSLESPNPFLCNPGDVVTVNAFPNTSGYDYYWFADSTTNGQTSKALLSTITTATFQTTQPKFYEVTIQKDGCERTVKLPISDKLSSGGFMYISGADNREYVMLSGYDKIESIQKNINPAETYYFANKSITLLPGFQSDKSTIFKAEVKGCPVGKDTVVFNNKVIFVESSTLSGNELLSYDGIKAYNKSQNSTSAGNKILKMTDYYVGMTPNTISFIFNQITDVPIIGDILYSFPFAQVPDGYILKILGKSYANGKVVYQTTPAKIFDVADSVNKSQTYGVNFYQAPPQVVYNPSATVSNARQTASSACSMSLTDRFKSNNVTDSKAAISFILYDHDCNKNTEEDQLLLDFTFDFSHMNTHLFWDKNTFIFSLQGYHNYTVGATVKYEIGS